MQRIATLRAVLSAIVVLLVVAPALADWDPGDPYKMHYPQLPDPNGWDVRNTYYIGLADDFQCTETGPITDFHVWTSWKGDVEAPIEFIHTAIYADQPDPDGTGPQYSMPLGDPLWHKDWTGGWTTRFWGTGDQGWYDPSIPLNISSDHDNIYQYNFLIDPADAFVQQEGTIYWLEVSFKLPVAEYEQGKRIGWKTTLDHFNDDAVWTEIVAGQPRVWNELRDPVTSESLDLAFVITPEPSTWVLLICVAMAGLVAAWRRR